MKDSDKAAVRQYCIRLVSSLMRPVDGRTTLPKAQVGPAAAKFIMECLTTDLHKNYGFDKPMFRLIKAGCKGYRVERLSAKAEAIQTRKGWVVEDLAKPLSEAAIEHVERQVRKGGRKPMPKAEKKQASNPFVWVSTCTMGPFSWV